MSLDFVASAVSLSLSPIALNFSSSAFMEAVSSSEDIGEALKVSVNGLYDACSSIDDSNVPEIYEKFTSKFTVN